VKVRATKKATRSSSRTVGCRPLEPPLRNQRKKNAFFLIFIMMMMMFFKQKLRKVPYRRRDVDWEKLLDRSWSHYPHVPVLQFALDIHRILLFVLANTSKFVFVHGQNIEKHHHIFSRGEHRNSLQLNTVLTCVVCEGFCFVWCCLGNENEKVTV